MAAGLTGATIPKPFRYNSISHFLPKPVTAASLFFPPIRHQSFLHYGSKVPRKTSLTVCFVVEDQTKPSSAHIENRQEEVPKDANENQILTPRVAERLERKRKERATYLIAAVMSSLGITSMAVMAVYYRFYWLEVPSFLSHLKFRVFFNQLSTCIGSKIGWCMETGRGSAFVWNVWHICSFSRCCCKYQFLSQFGLFLKNYLLGLLSWGWIWSFLLFLGGDGILGKMGS